jgi:hypothetical protein
MWQVFWSRSLRVSEQIRNSQANQRFTDGELFYSYVTRDSRNFEGPPHTTQILQTLDFCIFGVFTRKIQYRLPFANDNLTVNYIRNAVHTLKQTFVPDNVRSAFKLLGLEFNLTQTPYRLLFREDKLRRSQGFHESWEANSPMDKLSKGRQEARYGWINQDELSR